MATRHVHGDPITTQAVGKTVEEVLGAKGLAFEHKNGDGDDAWQCWSWTYKGLEASVNMPRCHFGDGVRAVRFALAAVGEFYGCEPFCIQTDYIAADHTMTHVKALIAAMFAYANAMPEMEKLD